MTSKIITLRLKEKELDFIRKLSKKENSDRSLAIRKLMDYGWVYFILKNYKEGKISIGNATKELDLTIMDFFDLLADLGIKSPVTYEEYLEGQEYARELLS